MLYRLFAALCVLALPLLTSAAQDRYGEIAIRHGRPQAYHEAIVLPGDASSQAVITFRIPNSLLVFVQDGDGFLADAEITVELLQNGAKADEAIWRGKKRVASFDQTRSDTDDLTGHVRFEVAPGTYAYRLGLAESNRRGRGPAHPFEVPNFSDGGIGTPFFAADSSTDSARASLDLVNLGRDAPFGRSVVTAVPMTFDGADAKLEYRLYRIDDQRSFGERRSAARRGESEFEIQEGDRLVRQGSVDLDSTIALGELQAGCFCWDVIEAGVGRLAFLDLETSTLENASYVLDIHLSSDAETLRQQAFFETHWRNMPLSLYDVELAIRNLSFIESRDRIRAMLRGSREEKVEAFRDYWEARDPSPATIRNELMQEYYARIDYAAAEFRTGKTPFPDGLRTDAARVYIIHGPPDDISSSFPSSGGVQQVWTYPDGRRFIFWAASSLEPLELESTTSGRGENGGS